MGCKILAPQNMPIAIKKILKLIEWSLFLLVLLVLFVVASPLLPTEKYVSTYVVATGSMEPEIMTGSLVLVTPSQGYGEGDVVVFKSPKDSTKTIVHRIDESITSSSGTTFVTKGDSNDSADPWTINSSDVQGDVKLIVPYVGSTIEWIKTPVGFGIFMLIPALIFGILQFLKINEGINEEVEKRVEEKLNKPGIGMGTMKSITSLVIIATTLLAIVAPPKIYALFSDTVTVSNLKIEIADFDETDPEPELGFEGGLSVFDKTTNSSLNVDEFNAKTRTNVNVVFRPAQLPTNAHHFTIIMQDMSNNHMVHYRTMLSRWTMENYTLDGHLGYTVWYEGLYWLQVNSYDMAGNPVDEFFAVLNVSNTDTSSDPSELHEGLEPEIDQTETEEDVETPIVEEPEVDDEIVDEAETPSDEEINEEAPTTDTEPPVESGKDTVEQIEP